MLHLALDNENSVAAAVWENINDPIYLYQDDQGHVYSPNKYVELILKIDTAKSQQLMTLLRAKKCQDRFYADTIIQPDGAVGLPEEVEVAVNKQKRADHDHREAMKRRAEVAAHQKVVEAEEHERNQIPMKDRHRLLMEQLKEQEKNEKQISRDKQRVAQELARQRQEALNNESKLKLKAMDDEGQHRRAAVKQEYDAELARRYDMEKYERACPQSRLVAERELILDRENASKAEVNRQINLCDLNNKSATHQANERARATTAY